MILEANISGSRATLLKLVEMFSTVRQAWEQAERQLVSSTTAALRASLPITPTPSAAAPSSDSDSALISFGRWSA